MTRNSAQVRRLVAVSAVALSIVVLAAGCASFDTAPSDSYVEPGAVTDPALPPDEQSFAPDGSAPGSDAGTRDLTQLGTGSFNPAQNVISTATIDLSTSNPTTLINEAVTLATDAGGRVETRSDSPSEQNGVVSSSSATLRVPDDRLDEVVAQISGLGTVTSSSLNQFDVTNQTVDMEARIIVIQTSIDKLLALMKDATSTSDLLEIENSLSARQAELDGLKAQRDAIADQVAFSTISVSAYSPTAVAGAAPGDFWGGILAGLASIGAFFGGFLVILGVIVPWVLLLAVLVAVVWLIRRFAQRAQRTPPVSPAPRTSEAIPPRPPVPPRSPAPPLPPQAPRA